MTSTKRIRLEGAVVVGLLGLLGLAGNPLVFPAEATWKAGVARAVITPEKPLWLAGYGHRSHPAEGKIHDLWVKALALEDPDGRRGVLLASDLLGFTRDIHEKLCAEIEKRHGLDRSRIILTCSHTHSGPVLSKALLPCYPLDEKNLALIDEYTLWLEGKVLDCIAEALGRLAPATLLSGQGRCGFAVNRRNNREADVPRLMAEGVKLQGPVDHDVPVLAVQSKDGALTAVVFGYACHNTNLDTYPWCGDYAGFAQIALEKSHPGTAALFWIGCGADQNPLPRRSLALCEGYGNRLAQAVEEVLARPMRTVAPGLRAAFEIVDLAFDRSPSRQELEATTHSANAIQARWAKGLLKLLDEKKKLPESYPYPVQVWRLGDDLLWISLGGEVVVDYSLRFKKEYGPATWVLGYANEVMGYIPSTRIQKEGGYESGALHEYGMPASQWAGGVEDRVATAVERLVAQVRASGGKGR